MATSKEKFQLVFEAQEAASAKIKKLNQELADLGGPAMVKSQREIKKLEREIKSLSGETQKGSIFFSRFTQGIAIGNIAADAAVAAWRGFVGLLKETVTAAGDAEQRWQMVTAALERHGVATNQNIAAVRSFTTDMMLLTGVADEDWGAAVQTMVDRGASLSQSFQLVAATADIAASKDKDMAKTLQMVADAIGQRDLGALEKYGVAVDKNTSFTTQLNTAIAQLNANFGGAATDAATGFSIRLNVLKESFGELQETAGGVLLPVLTEFINLLTDFVNEFTRINFADQFDAQGKQVVTTGAEMIDMMSSMRSHMTGWVNVVVGGSRIITNAFQIVYDSVKMALSPIADLLAAALAVYKGDTGAAIEIIKNSVSNVGAVAQSTSGDIDDLAAAVVQLNNGLGQVASSGNDASLAIKSSTQAAADAIAQLDVVGQTVSGVAISNANNLKAAMDQVTATLPQAVADTGEAVDEQVTMATAGMMDTSSYAIRFTANAGQQMKSMMGGAVDSMIGNMVTGRQSFGEVFKGIAQDFMTFFIKQALAMVMNMFIPGLGSILGGIFDTPANDRMAAQQGRDFMSWFTRGALAEAQGGSELAVGIGRTSNRIVPVASSGAGGGGMVMMNVTISGNVMSDQYVEKTIAPKLRKLVTDGRSLLSIQNENKTGGRDVNIT
ncbi:MAG: hypothetical protein WC052_04655 [Patescibacteria group bacterium]|jgi:hypothetical protein